MNNGQKTAFLDKYTLYIFFGLYTLLLCFRGQSVGVDVDSYVYNYFYFFRQSSWNTILHTVDTETAFPLLIHAVGLVSSNPQIFIAVVALLSVLPIMYLYGRESKNALLTCACFAILPLFEIFFSGLRQGLALAFAVPAYYCAKHKKIYLFLLTVLIARFFHASAIIMLLIYPVYHFKITRKWLWVIIPATVLLYIYNSIVFNFLLFSIGGKYAEANAYGVYGFGETNQYGLLVLFVLFSAYSFLMLDEKKADSNTLGARNLLLLATALQCFAPLHFVVSRMNFYFMLFIPTTITLIPYQCKSRYRQLARLLSWMMTCYFIFYFFFKKGDSLHIFDYEFFL